jgi:hypothetical protein
MIRIRVYPQHNSIGARRARKAKARQRKLRKLRAWHRQQARMARFPALQGAWGGAYAPSFASPFASSRLGGFNASPWSNAWGSTSAYLGGLGACSPGAVNRGIGGYGGYGGWGSNLGFGSGGLFSGVSSWFG